MRWVYETLQSTGSEPSMVSHLAITFMAMAVVSKLISFPFTLRQSKTSQKMSEINPKLEELRKKYGYDERILQQKTMEFYKENNVAQQGCSSCLPLIVQMIILLALFGVMRAPEAYLFDSPEKMQHISKNFFWISNLMEPDPYWFALPLINSLTQILVQRMNPQMKQAANAGGSAASSMNTMMYTMPIVFFFVFLRFPAGLLLYWAFGNILEVVVRGILLLFRHRRSNEEAA